jgi:hypothetical protein
MPIIYTKLRFSSSENSIVEIELDTNFSYQFNTLSNVGSAIKRIRCLYIIAGKP